jgi:hypothetical protein
VAALVAVFLFVLLGVVAVAIDLGFFMAELRLARATADAAALAAAGELFKNYPTDQGKDSSGTARAAAEKVARSIADAHKRSLRPPDVFIPPAKGLFAGEDGYAEVRVTYDTPRFFSNMFGSGAFGTPARAVARGSWGRINYALIALDPDDRGAVNAHGNGNLTVTGGGVMVNSNDPNAALWANGSGSVISAPYYDVTGGSTTSGGATINGTVNTQVPPIIDPLYWLPEPAAPANGTMTVENLGMGNKRYTLNPGQYTNLPNFSSGDVVVFSGNGIYYLASGGFKSSGATIQMGDGTTGVATTGIMIFNNASGQNDKIDITGGSVTLAGLPPNLPGLEIYNPILIFQRKAADVPVKITGQGELNLSGTIYARDSPGMIEGNGDLSLGSQYITRTLDIGGNGAVNINYPAENGPRIRQVQLVE